QKDRENRRNRCEPGTRAELAVHRRSLRVAHWFTLYARGPRKGRAFGCSLNKDAGLRSIDDDRPPRADRRRLRGRARRARRRGRRRPEHRLPRLRRLLRLPRVHLLRGVARPLALPLLDALLRLRRLLPLHRVRGVQRLPALRLQPQLRRQRVPRAVDRVHRLHLLLRVRRPLAPRLLHPEPAGRSRDLLRGDRPPRPRARDRAAMRAVVQRVRSARVEIAGEIVGAIDRGLLAYLGFGRGDTAADRAWMLQKIVGLRVFEDEAAGDGKMSLSLADVGGGLLLVSQFTLYGDLRRGRRPSFDEAMPPAEAQVAYDAAVREA